jgi:hypothetical protein
MTRLIMFLLRLKLGVKKYEVFTFTNQKTKNGYYFDTHTIYRIRYIGIDCLIEPSDVSINWLLNPCCEIERVEV